MQLVCHVDDSLLSFSSDQVGTVFKDALLTRFNGTDEGPEISGVVRSRIFSTFPCHRGSSGLLARLVAML